MVIAGHLDQFHLFAGDPQRRCHGIGLFRRHHCVLGGLQQKDRRFHRCRMAAGRLIRQPRVEGGSHFLAPIQQAVLTRVLQDVRLQLRQIEHAVDADRAGIQVGGKGRTGERRVPP